MYYVNVMVGATELDEQQPPQQNGTDGATEWEYNGMVWLPVAASGVHIRKMAILLIHSLRHLKRLNDAYSMLWLSYVLP